MNTTIDPTLRYLGSHAELMVILTRLHLFSQMGHLMEPEQQRKNAEDFINPIHAAIMEHHAEEERELFVELQAQPASDEDKQLVVSLVNRLTREHRSIERQWDTIHQALNTLLAGGSELPSQEDCGELAERYQQHAMFEETVMLPLARKLLLNQDGSSSAELSHRIDHMPRFF
ncbi:MAG: hemerythrin domain-containing protein [Burkholderiaceae bacterium]